MTLAETSAELQAKCNSIFGSFKDRMQNDFGHIYKGAEFFTFYEGVVRTVVTEALNITYGVTKIDETLMTRISKLFGGIINTTLIPYFEELKSYASSKGISDEEQLAYSYNYVIRSLSDLLPADAMNQLNKEFKKDNQELAGNAAEKNMLNKWHLVDLINMAKSDGSFDAEEKDYLIQKAQRLGVDVGELRKYFDTDEIIEIKVPHEQFRKIEYFVDMVLTMSADGVIHEKEEEFCIKMGKAYQFPTSKINEAIQIFKDTLSSGRPTITAVPTVIRLLKDRVR